MHEVTTTLGKRKRLPYIGETVISEILRLERVVTAIDSVSVTLESKKSNSLTSFFDMLSRDFKRTVSLDFFETYYIMPEEDVIKNLTFTAAEVANVEFKVGDVFQHCDTLECVMVGPVSRNLKEQPPSLSIELFSLDRMIDGEYLTYLLSETLFKKNFKKLNKDPIYTHELSLSF